MKTNLHKQPSANEAAALLVTLAQANTPIPVQPRPGEHWIETELRAHAERSRVRENHRRLVEAIERMAAGANAPKIEMSGEATPMTVTDALIWKVFAEILEHLDSKCRKAPSPSMVFLRICRDKMTLAEMCRKHGWPERTLKLRKATLIEFLARQYKLTLEAFFVDRRMFNHAENQLRDFRAKKIRHRAAAEQEDDKEY